MHGYHLLPVIVRDGAEARLTGLRRACATPGIGVQVHYIPVYRLPHYRDVARLPAGRVPRRRGLLRGRDLAADVPEHDRRRRRARRATSSGAALAMTRPRPGRSESRPGSCERARGLIPACTQTLSKNPTQWVQGVAPAYVARGEGAHVWDVDGNRYVDFPMALGPGDPRARRTPR